MERAAVLCPGRLGFSSGKPFREFLLWRSGLRIRLQWLGLLQRHGFNPHAQWLKGSGICCSCSVARYVAHDQSLARERHVPQVQQRREGGRGEGRKKGGRGEGRKERGRGETENKETLKEKLSYTGKN